jgi:RHS repeat-associated protein
MTSVTLPGSGGTVTFAYDPFGRRIKKVTSTTTSIFAYDGDNVVEETNSSGAVVARYEGTQNIDEPLAMLRSSATSYYHADGLGSVTSLSSAAGSIANTYTYDSFGKLTASTGSLANPFQYTARESDTETGLYYYRARYYDPNSGRLLSEDPIGFRSATNFYPYVRNNPSNLNDPSGLYALQGFTPGGAVDTMLAIDQLVHKLNSGCCVPPGVRDRLLRYLAGGNNGSGVTFVYHRNLPGGVCGSVGDENRVKSFWSWVTNTVDVADWGNPGCGCLPATIAHELVHLTLKNFATPLAGVTPEKEPDAVEDCFGKSCK